jgi:hypothetical protein
MNQNQLSKLALTEEIQSAEIFAEKVLLIHPELSGNNKTQLTNQQRHFLRLLTVFVFAKIKKYEGRDLTKEEAALVNKRGFSIMSGKGTGKDFIVAVAMLWFMVVFHMKFPRIMATANTQDQLQDVLWAEVAKLMYGGSHLQGEKRPILPNLIEFNKTRFYWKHPIRHGQSVTKPGTDSFAAAKTVNRNADANTQKSTLQGRHADYYMFVVDEAGGIPDPVFEPLETTLTSAVNFALIVFNPTKNYGYAVETHTKYSEDWVCLRWNAEDCERLDSNHLDIMRRRVNGDRNNDYYRVNVLGLPPKTQSDSFFNYTDLMEAVERQEYSLPPEEADVILGVDIGVRNDPTIIMAKKGPFLDPEIVSFTCDDPRETAERIALHYKQVGAKLMCIDANTWGWGPAGMCRDMGLNVRKIETHRKATNQTRYANVKAELVDKLATAFREGDISIPNDEDLILELSTLKVQENHKGQMQVMNKEMHKKELGKLREGSKSPNKLDALLLTYAVNSNAYFSSQRANTRHHRAWFQRPSGKPRSGLSH